MSVNPVLNKLIRSLTAFCFMSCSLATSAALPKATLDDYVWAPLSQFKKPNDFYSDCDYDSLVAYTLCLENQLEQHDNQLSKKWKISNKVLREKDTIYIKVPNRKRPLAMRDEHTLHDLQNSYYYSLYDYDASRQLLYLLKTYPDVSDNLVLIDLASGLNQEFEGNDIAVSPDGRYVASVDRYLGVENIHIWKKAPIGGYQSAYSADINELTPHLNYYHGEDSKKYVQAVSMNWLSNNKVQIDFYYTLNSTDDMAYRVRFNVVKPKLAAPWQIIAIR